MNFCENRNDSFRVSFNFYFAYTKQKIGSILKIEPICIILTLLKKGIKTKKFNFLSRQDLCLDRQKLNFFQRTQFSILFYRFGVMRLLNQPSTNLPARVSLRRWVISSQYGRRTSQQHGQPNLTLRPTQLILVRRPRLHPVVPQFAYG